MLNIVSITYNNLMAGHVYSHN